ncbi:hypothetical protein MLD38_005543 [Melastoma candidum]|uniref:Uncharacterized protein n=1 Tax=Melastoma candidum TaxID=119954 RepID=A0ACB9RNN5_9MYRT|nr:hypothetical protein MLD38_005543 [Melastoma candidum]
MYNRALPLLQIRWFSAWLSRNEAAAASASTSPCGSLLDFCCGVNSLPKAHGLLLVRGLAGDLLLWTKLLSSYGSLGRVAIARKVFDEIPDPDFYSWKVMLRWYFLNDRYSDIIGFRALMRCSGKDKHDDVIISIVLKACSELRFLEEGRKLHSYIVKVGSRDSFVFSGLVNMYAKCGKVKFSRRVFDEIDDNDSVVSWTSMINGYVQNGFVDDGLALFNRMREGLVQGNQHTFGSLVTACSNLGALHQGRWLHGHLIKKGIDITKNSFLSTSLLDMYAKCGEVVDARKVFDELLATDLVSWTAMIVGYTQSCSPLMALELFTNEKWAGILPNSVTIAGALSACARLENLRFGMSIHGFEIKLGLEDETILNALLDILYSRFDLGEIAIKKMQELHLEKACYYVLISNMYASDGRWSQVKQIRELMEGRRLTKSPGCSLLGIHANANVPTTRVALAA